MVAGVVAQRGKGLFHGEAQSLGHHAFGLLDNDAAVERHLELLVHELPLERGAVLENRDRGDIGESLRHLDISEPHVARVDVEQVEGADNRSAQPHGEGMHGMKSG